MQVNSEGAFLCGEAAARQWVDQMKGPAPDQSNMSSINGRSRNSKPGAIFQSQKVSFQQLTKVMALRWQAEAFRVNMRLGRFSTQNIWAA